MDVFNQFYVLADFDDQEADYDDQDTGLLGYLADDLDEIEVQELGYQAGELDAPENYILAHNLGPAPIPALPTGAALHPALHDGPAPLVVAGDLQDDGDADHAANGDDNKYLWVLVAPRHSLRRNGPRVHQEYEEPPAEMFLRWQYMNILLATQLSYSTVYEMVPEEHGVYRDPLFTANPLDFNH